MSTEYVAQKTQPVKLVKAAGCFLVTKVFPTLIANPAFSRGLAEIPVQAGSILPFRLCLSDIFQNPRSNSSHVQDLQQVWTVV